MKRLIAAAAALLLGIAAPLSAQEKPQPPVPSPTAQEKPRSPAPPPAPQVPLSVQVVISKYAGDKKLSSVPFTLSVISNDARASVRMGVDVPVLTGSGAVQSVNYQKVGTDIDCTADARPGGTYRVGLTITDRSVMPADRDAPAGSRTEAERSLPPGVRNFQATFSVLLHDGQTAQHMSATDPFSGEVVRIDVTLNVLK